MAGPWQSNLSSFRQLFEVNHQISYQPQQRHSAYALLVCVGDYYAVAEGTSIHAYKIEGDSLRLVNRVSCERAVLALSISAGPGRLALAALLENRIGIYIDSSRTGTSKGWSHWETAGTLQNTASDTASVMDFETGDVGGDVPVDNVDATSSGLASLGSGDILHQSIPTPFRQNRSVFFHDHEACLPTTHRMYQRSSSQASSEAGTEEVSEPLWSLPKLVYKDVCTFKDQPYSVAISPSRQCVAFGCQTGVELYWVCVRPPLVWAMLTHPTKGRLHYRQNAQ